MSPDELIRLIRNPRRDLHARRIARMAKQDLRQAGDVLSDETIAEFQRYADRYHGGNVDAHITPHEAPARPDQIGTDVAGEGRDKTVWELTPPR